MNLSVAISTYNGAAYLPEQLASIASQTRLPDEIVICDDCSTDETRTLVEAFAVTTPIPVHLHVNDVNIGSTRTFERAIERCTGDIIALCDQDDVWREDKLQLIEAAFLKAPHAGVVFSDAELVDENLKPLGRTMWTELGFDKKQQELIAHGRYLEVLLPGWTVTGATMAFRSKYNQLCLPIPDEIPMIHDGWIALVISAVAKVILLDEQLIRYRQHSGQQIGAPLPPDREKQLRGLERIEDALQRPTSFVDLPKILTTLRERLFAQEDAFDSRNALSYINHYLGHLQVRTTLPRGKFRRLPTILRELIRGRYHRYSNGFLSAAKDLVS